MGKITLIYLQLIQLAIAALILLAMPDETLLLGMAAALVFFAVTLFFIGSPFKSLDENHEWAQKHGRWVERFIYDHAIFIYLAITFSVTATIKFFFV